MNIRLVHDFQVYSFLKCVHECQVCGIMVSSSLEYEIYGSMISLHNMFMNFAVKQRVPPLTTVKPFCGL